MFFHRAAKGTLHQQDGRKRVGSLGGALSFLEATSGKGLRISRHVNAILELTDINYGVEAGLSNARGWESIDSTDIQKLFPDTPEDKDITGLEAMHRMREQKLVDLSKETLDARFYNITKVLQFEMLMTVMVDLRLLTKISTDKDKYAVQMFNRYAPEFLDDNLPRKLEILNEIEKNYRTLLRQGDTQQGKRVIRHLANRTQLVGKQMGEVLEFFGQTYAALGFNQPEAASATPVESVAMHVGAPLVSSTTAIEAQTSKGDSESAIILKSEAADLIRGSQPFVRQWSMSRSARRGAGYGPMVQQLVLGLSGPTGAELLPRMSENVAGAIVDVLKGMYDIGSVYEHPKEAASLLKEAFLQEHRWTSACTVLRTKASTEGMTSSIDYPSIPPVHAQTIRILDDWHGYRQLILRAWPVGKGAAAVQAIETTLLAGGGRQRKR
jgi:hypothetical protein